MSTNYIHISHLGTYLSTQLTHDACPMSHLPLYGDFTTSELRAIKFWRVSKGIFFISDIYNHQSTHLQYSSTDNDLTFNIIHNFNWPRKNHTTIAAWRMWKKSIITIFDESKANLRASMGNFTIDNNKYIKTWQWLLFRDIHTLYYREHVT